MVLSNKLSCEAGSFSHCRLNPHLCLQSEVWGFISLFYNSGLHGRSRSQLVPPGLSAHEYGTTQSAICCLAGSSATALLGVLSTWLPISAPPTSLDECFFFNSLVIRLPCHLIFCQFWGWFLFLNLSLSFFWLCEEAQCVYLRLHLAWKSLMSHIAGTIILRQSTPLLICSCFFFFFLRFYFKKEEKRGRKRKRNINMWLPLMCSPLETRAQACALTGNQTGDPLVHRLALNPLSHSSQG